VVSVINLGANVCDLAMAYVMSSIH